MGKRIVIIFILFHLSVYGGCDDVGCRALLDKYRIDKDIKTSKGWIRVCENNKLVLYTTRRVLPSEQKELCECLSFDRGVTRSIENYNFIRGQE